MNWPTSWTEERCDQLRTLWGEGLSCSLIGEAMGVSRNAVIGKVHRLHLPRRRTAQQMSGWKWTTRPAKPRIPRATRKRHKVKPEGRRMPRQVEPIIAPEPVEFTASTWQPLPGSTPVSLTDLPAGACKWPVGDPYAPASEARFCACPAAGDGPYCPEHEARSTGRCLPKNKPEYSPRFSQKSSELTVVGRIEESHTKLVAA